mmetsp:Transcript_68075/g.183848  ORF Transcript_68075/g.183848 Transcript_68075/m.183848 type:complete len:213 (+) Transcript_68075:847-1485(+)
MRALRVSRRRCWPRSASARHAERVPVPEHRRNAEGHRHEPGRRAARRALRAARGRRPHGGERGRPRRGRGGAGRLPGPGNGRVRQRRQEQPSAAGGQRRRRGRRGPRGRRGEGGRCRGFGAARCPDWHELHRRAAGARHRPPEVDLPARPRLDRDPHRLGAAVLGRLRHRPDPRRRHLPAPLPGVHAHQVHHVGLPGRRLQPPLGGRDRPRG